MKKKSQPGIEWEKFSTFFPNVETKGVKEKITNYEKQKKKHWRKKRVRVIVFGVSTNHSAHASHLATAK